MPRRYQFEIVVESDKRDLKRAIDRELLTKFSGNVPSWAYRLQQALHNMTDMLAGGPVGGHGFMILVDALPSETGSFDELAVALRRRTTMDVARETVSDVKEQVEATVKEAAAEVEQLGAKMVDATKHLANAPSEDAVLTGAPEAPPQEALQAVPGVIGAQPSGAATSAPAAGDAAGADPQP